MLSVRDHYSHVTAVISSQRVAELWLGGRVADYPIPFRTWVSAVQDAQEQGNGQVAGDLPAGWHNDGFAIEELGCGTPLSHVVTVGVGDEKNDQRLVLSVDHGSVRVLLTADATGETQDVAMQNFSFPQLDSTVVTAAHHGAESHGSNRADWAKAVRPEIIIYSAGESHAHPRCPVLETYRAAGSLMGADRHSMRCGTRLGYEPAKQTFLREYNTFDRTSEPGAANQDRHQTTPIADSAPRVDGPSTMGDGPWTAGRRSARGYGFARASFVPPSVGGLLLGRLGHVELCGPPPVRRLV